MKILVLIDRFTGADLQDPKLRELERAADGLGYGIEYAYAEKALGRGGRLSRQHTARGVRGVLVSLHVSSVLPALNWDDFAVVMVGEEYADQPFDRVGTDWRQGFDLLTSRMKAVGGSLGFCLARYSAHPDAAGEELGRILHAEALLQQAELAAEGRGRAPAFRFDQADPEAPARFLRWIRENGIDALMCNSRIPISWLRAADLPAEARPRPFLLPWDPEAGRAGISGWSLNLGKRLSLGLHLLHENLLLDRRGFAALPTKTLVPMKWEEGEF